MDMILGLVADAANKGDGNKLNALGIFHTIYCSRVPLTHAQMALAIEFKIAPYEKGKTFEMEIRLLDPDGVRLFKVDAKLETNRDSKALSPIAPLALNLQNVPLPKFGSYRFDILVNGNRRGEIQFEVNNIASVTDGGD